MTIRRNGLGRFFKLLGTAERRHLVPVALVMIVSAFFQLVGVGAFYPFLKVAANPETVNDAPLLVKMGSALGVTSTQGLVIVLGIVVVCLVLLANVGLAVAEWAVLRYEWELHHSLSMRLFEGYLRHPYPFFLENNSSGFSRTLLNDIYQLTGGLLHACLSLISKGFVTLVLLGLLLWVNPTVTLLVLTVVGGGYAIGYAFIHKGVQRRGVEVSAANEERFKLVQETFSGIKETKVLGREKEFIARYQKPSAELSKSYTAYQTYQILPKYVIEALALSTLLLVVVYFLVQGRDIVSVIPTIGLFAVAGYRLLPVFRDVLSALASFRFHRETLARVEAPLMEAERIVQDQEVGPSEPLEFEQGIRLEGVSFSYGRRDRLVLDRVDLEIPKNAWVALVGTTGSGKSTILDLLMGLQSPTTGKVTVDGVPLQGWAIRRWQQRLGYVPQEVFLKDDTIASNIAFGLPSDEIDQACVEAAARVAQIHEFIVSELPQGYDTIVGERGARLSGGQRQRLGIARALYHNPDILILDEATSDVDNLTEAAIGSALKSLAGTKTIIMVAHRLSTVRNCDTIHVMGAGGIITSGTYDDLLRDPTFKSMVMGSTSGGPHPMEVL